MSEPRSDAAVRSYAITFDGPTSVTLPPVVLWVLAARPDSRWLVTDVEMANTASGPVPYEIATRDLVLQLADQFIELDAVSPPYGDPALRLIARDGCIVTLLGYGDPPSPQITGNYRVGDPNDFDWPTTDAIERDLIQELDAHDALVAKLARGEIDLTEFDRRYDNFYPRYPLDGHEAVPSAALLQKYEARIALHRAIWHEVLTKVTGLAYATTDLITLEQAIEKVRALAARHQLS